MSDKPKKIANKRDKDQMRVWSPDQYPPIIKDYDNEISGLRALVNAQGLAINDVRQKMSFRENHYAFAFPVVNTFNFRLVDGAFVPHAVESYFSRTVSETLQITPDDIEAITANAFPLVLGEIMPDLWIQYLFGLWYDGRPCLTTNPNIYEVIVEKSRDGVVFDTVTVTHPSPASIAYNTGLYFGMVDDSINVYVDDGLYGLKNRATWQYATSNIIPSDLQNGDLVTLKVYKTIGGIIPIEADDYHVPDTE